MFDDLLERAFVDLGAEVGFLLLGAGEGADVALVELPANVGGAPGGVGGEVGFGEVLGDTLVEEVRGEGGSLGGVGLGGFVFKVGGGAEEDGVAAGGGGADDALVANPSGGGGDVGVFAELGFVGVVLVGVVVDVGVGEDLDPGAAALHDDDLVAGGDEGDLLGIGIGGDVDVGVVEDGGAVGLVIVLSALLGTGLSECGQGQERGCCDDTECETSP